MTQINYRRLRRSLGSRTTRRQGTKQNTAAVKSRSRRRPSVSVKELAGKIRRGELTMDDI